jgi:predicted nucleic acid-binding protein
VNRLLVIDSSVAIKLVIPENQSLQAIGLRSGFQLAAPDILFSECANTLWKKVRRSEMSEADASEAMDVLADLDLTMLSCRDLSQDALQIALRIDHPAYGCLYLAAALQLDTVLVTADQKLLHKLTQAGGAWMTLAVSLEDPHQH